MLVARGPVQQWHGVVGWLAWAALAAMTPTVACSLPRPDAAPDRPTPPALQATVQPVASPLGRLGQAPPASPGAPDALVAQAIADAAARADAPATEVRIVSVTAREWPDRSLGCPKPGLGYAQVITPGYVIVLEVRGRQFEYHTDQVQVVLCEP